MEVTVDEFRSKLDEFKNEFVQIVKNAPFVQAQELTGTMLTRIFVEGKDSNGNDIGQYAGAESKSGGRYKAKRNAAGRRIDKVDLQFEGNLLNSVKAGRDEEGAVIGFNNLKESEIAGHNEKRFKGSEGTIFPPTIQEKENAVELMDRYIVEQANDKLKMIFGNG